MAKNNDTGLFQLDNGNWAYRIVINRKNLKIDTTCRQDEQGNPYKTKIQARDARAAKLVELKNPNPVENAKDAKLVDVYNKYLKNGAVGKAPSTVRKQQSMWENHIYKNFGEKYLSQITLDDLYNYLQKLYTYGDDIDGYTGGYAYKYVEGFLKFFYLLFGCAYRDDLIDTARYTKMFLDSGTRLSMPKMTQEDALDEENVKAYSKEELAKINTIMQKGNCYTAFLTGYYLGCRISENYGLRWSDISWSDGTITINKQMLYQDGCFCLCPVKTLKSVRIIDMGDELQSYLYDEYKRQESQRQKLGFGYRNTEVVLDKTKNGKVEKIVGGDFINRKENGELLTINSIKYWSRIIKQEMGIDFQYHSLRKTHATMMANANTPVLELMNRLGHKKYDTTMAYYINSNLLAREKLKQNLANLDYSPISNIYNSESARENKEQLLKNISWYKDNTPRRAKGRNDE